jgi:D-glycero-alpha-D-manno-heptose 1-phosphate guanylyltransferase
MEAIVLAGGLGTRLASRLEGTPKAMAPVAGRPFLEILLKQLERAGCGRVLLSVGHLRGVIQDHFGPAFEGLALEYVVEEEPLGTGGAMRRALERASEKAVLVLNGDTFLDADYAAMLRFHQAQGSALTIAVTQQADAARYGEVRLEGKRIVGFEEKGPGLGLGPLSGTGSGPVSGPILINAGAYVVERAIAWPAALGERFSFERDFLVPETARLAPAGFRVEGFFLDIGVPGDLDRAQTELAQF